MASEHLLRIDPDKYSDYFLKYAINYDSPQILQPKSGPSAGIVAYLCLMSVALEKPVIPYLAMTGEIAIDGSVLKIGGVKEKSQGAQRYGVKYLVLPIGNKNDFINLPDNLRNSFEKVYFVKNTDEVFRIGFGLETMNIDCYNSEKDYIGDNKFLKEDIRRNEDNLISKMFSQMNVNH